MSGLDHLKRLSAVKSNTGVKLLSPAAAPGSHCPMHTALAFSSDLTGLSTLVIGTPECSTYSRLVIPKPEGKSGELHWMYVLDAHEVVFGCREGLIEAVRKMDQAGAKAILMIVTCVPELIGEDMEGIVHEIQAGLNARLCFVQLGHFKCNSYPSGYWKTMEALGGLMEPKPTAANWINVLGRSHNERQNPLPAVLKALEERGYRLRILGPGASLADFMDAPDALLNIVVSPYGAPLALQMERELGIPRFSLHDVYHPYDIDNVYEELAAALGLSWGEAFDADRREAWALHEQSGEQLQELRYVCAQAGAAMPLPLAVYLAGMGMEPLALHMEEFYPDDKPWAKKLTAAGYNPLVCHMANRNTDAHVLEQLDPDVILGGSLGTGSRAASVPRLFDLGSTVGYERTAALLNRMTQALEHRAILTKGGR